MKTAMVPSTHTWVNTQYVNCLQVRSDRAGNIYYRNYIANKWVRVRDQDSIATIVDALPSQARRRTPPPRGLELPPTPGAVLKPAAKPSLRRKQRKPPALDHASVKAYAAHIRSKQDADLKALQARIAEMRKA